MNKYHALLSSGAEQLTEFGAFPFCSGSHTVLQRQDHLLP